MQEAETPVGREVSRNAWKVKSALTNQDALGSAALPQVCQTYKTECRVDALFAKDHFSNRGRKERVTGEWLLGWSGSRPGFAAVGRGPDVMIGGFDAAVLRVLEG